MPEKIAELTPYSAIGFVNTNQSAADVSHELCNRKSRVLVPENLKTPPIKDRGCFSCRPRRDRTDDPRIKSPLL